MYVSNRSAYDSLLNSI